MKIIIKESQLVRIINELTLGHKNGYALVDNKPYKVKKSILTITVNNLVQNKDGSATFSWSAMGKKGDEVIPAASVNKIVKDLNDYGESTITTKMGNVSIVPA